MTLEAIENRTVIRISGNDAERFLENLVTCQVAGLENGEIRFGALLSPQGKILFDFFLVKRPDCFWLEIDQHQSAAFVQRLTFYRLRAAVEIQTEEDVSVYAAVEDNFGAELTVEDPRHRQMGYRFYANKLSASKTGEYARRRVALVIGEGGLDFEYGDAYPHEVLMDQFAGVDFKKGCYVGQEVVSRMQHRGSTKKRLVRVLAQNGTLRSGDAVEADGKPAGTMGTVSGTSGLAVLRLDRIQKASQVLCGTTAVEISLPDWVNFSWPEG